MAKHFEDYLSNQAASTVKADNFLGKTMKNGNFLSEMDQKLRAGQKVTPEELMQMHKARDKDQDFQAFISTDGNSFDFSE